MKYQLTAENHLEENRLQSEFKSQKPIIDTMIPLVLARSVMAGFRLGIFEAIGADSITLDQLAIKLSLNSDALKRLLRVLICADYVIEEDDRYRLTEMSKNTMLSGSPVRCLGAIHYAYIRWNMLNSLEDVIRTGNGVDLHHHYLKTSEDWSAYQHFMAENSEVPAKEIALLVPVKANAAKMLDVGGAHGLYGAMICRRNPPMKSTVLDLPGAVEHAQQIARENGIDDVVTFQAGNALKDDFGRDYDLVFIGNIMHHFTRDQNQAIIDRIHNALTANGTIAVLEMKASETGGRPDLFQDTISLMFCVNSGTQCYTASDYAGWLESSGFTDIKQHQVSRSSQLLITAVKR